MWLCAGLFAASGFLFALDISDHHAAKAVRQGVTDVTAPALGAISTTISTSRSVFAEAHNYANLSDEVGRLRDENRMLRDWRQKAVELEDRAERYEALLQMQPDTATSMIGARAIADVRTPFSRSIIINAGHEAGVAEGHAVLGAKGLIGRVISAGSRSARVLLVTDLESRIPVHVGRGRHRSILAGTNGAEPTLMHLPPGTDLRDGDLVVTSGEAHLLPPGLAIGEVRLGDNGSVSVALGADPSAVGYVRVHNSRFPVDVADGAPPLPAMLAESAAVAEAAPAPPAVTGSVEAEGAGAAR